MRVNLLIIYNQLLINRRSNDIFTLKQGPKYFHDMLKAYP